VGKKERGIEETPLSQKGKRKRMVNNILETANSCLSAAQMRRGRAKEKNEKGIFESHQTCNARKVNLLSQKKLEVGKETGTTWA